MINKIILFLFASSVYASSTCEDIQRSYITGDYKKCSKQYSASSNLSPECRYIAALCDIGNYEYDNARYELSLLSVPDKKVEKLSSVNALALNSLTELAYLKGTYSKARMLSAEINSVLSQKFPNSYEYAVSEILLTKSYFDAKDSFSARKRISMLKLSMDPLLYSSVEP